MPLELDDDGLQKFRNELSTEYRTMYLRRLSRRIKTGKIRIPGNGGDPMPPRHCKWIRYTGLFAPQGRKERLESCRRLICQWRCVPGQEEEEAVEEEQGPRDQEQIRKELFIGQGNERRTFPATCRFCKGYMTPVDRIDGEKTMLMLSYLIAVMRWLAGKAAGPPEKQPWLLPEHFREFVAAELIAEERRRLAADQA